MTETTAAQHGSSGVECAECAVPRETAAPDALWLSDARGNTYCCECLVLLELTGQLRALASEWLRELEDELWR
ncbi:hypothetical protein ABZ863_26520 [Saccharomonospora sp. NPDC046836]|uniref:hypothetical protein n=1 Tax=Saccharomonospora sp. NPDC046836 TaxID=3156921 RepID=UPI0033D08558